MPSMLGAYGEWAAGLLADPPRLSFRRGEYTDIETWRRIARRRYREALLQPDAGGVPRVTVQHHMEYDGLAIRGHHVAVALRPADRGAAVEAGGRDGKIAGGPG